MSQNTKKRFIQIASIQTFIRRSSGGKGGQHPHHLTSSGATTKATVLKDISNKKTHKETMNTSSGIAREKRSVCGNFDLIILDEAHGAIAHQYLALIDMYPGSIFVGLTATPFRLKETETLGQVFQKGISGPSISQLIERKILVKPVIYAPSLAHFSRLTTGVAKLNVTIVAAVRQWKRYCGKGQDGEGARRTIAFCCSIDQSKMLVDTFLSEGIMAEHMDGNTKESVRRSMIHRFQQNITTVL